MAMVAIVPEALRATQVTILGYGALLSEASARLTFPHLTEFRLVRLKQYRRVFRHPHLFLIRQGVVHPSETLHLASLTVEPADEKCSFVAAAFSVTLDDEQRTAFVAREPEYRIISAPYYDIDDTNVRLGEGVLCVASRDDLVSEPIDPEWGISSVWDDWGEDSGLLPADVYLRHCLLAVQKAGPVAEQSFLQDTMLIDRKTTLAEYMQEHGDRVMSSRPPAHLLSRFSG